MGEGAWWRLVWRGCRRMPYVGEHPGTEIVLGLILIGGAAGHEGGWRGMLIGAVIMSSVILPMYLYGAYSRAKLSLRLSRSRVAPGSKGEG